MNDLPGNTVIYKSTHSLFEVVIQYVPEGDLSFLVYIILPFFFHSIVKLLSSSPIIIVTESV